MAKHPDTEFFCYHDIDGSHDDFVRAVSILLGQTCAATLAELTAIAADTEMPVTTPIVHFRFLLRHGWIRQKQPRQSDGRRYSVREWLAANPAMPMLLDVARRTTCAIDGRLHDTIDCSARCITGLWVRREDVNRLVIRQDYSPGLRSDTPYRTTKIWDKPAIRRVLADCDRRSGLRSAELPIIYYTGGRSLGKFGLTDHRSGAIYINVDYFDNRIFPEEEAEDTIRHEAAHHADNEKFGKMGHGPTWKKCCLLLGANPMRFYSETRAERFRNSHLREEALNRVYDCFFPGIQIDHPRFGRGVVMKVNGAGHKRNIDVSFPDAGMKKLGIDWVRLNCRICAA